MSIPSSNALNYSPFPFIFKFFSGQEILCLALLGLRFLSGHKIEPK